MRVAESDDEFDLDEDAVSDDQIRVVVADVFTFERERDRNLGAERNSAPLAGVVGSALLAIVAPSIIVGTGRRLMLIPRTQGDDLVLAWHSDHLLASAREMDRVVAIFMAAVKVLS